jgi:hypothetical protein
VRLRQDGDAFRLSLINYDNRLGRILKAQAYLKTGSIIACDAPRHLFALMHPAVHAGLPDRAAA